RSGPRPASRRPHRQHTRSPHRNLGAEGSRKLSRVDSILRASRSGALGVKRLLDTNAYVALKRGHERVAELVRESTELAFSTIVLGELLFGFRNGARTERNIHELDELLSDA